MLRASILVAFDENRIELDEAVHDGRCLKYGAHEEVSRSAR